MIVGDSRIRGTVRQGACAYEDAMAKKPFDVDTVFRRIKKEVAGFADAAMFDLRTRGFTGTEPPTMSAERFEFVRRRISPPSSYVANAPKTASQA